MNNHTLASTFFLLFGLLTVTDCKKTSTTYDLIIQNGIIVDGTGAPAYRASIAVKKDRIVKISKEDIAAAETVKLINAIDLIVSPGFIDMHTNVEVNIQEYPSAENFIRQGITTIMASLHSGDQAFPLDIYADTLKMAPNMGYFAGHTWIRKQVMGLENKSPSTEEMDSMKYYVEATMRQGALGLSSGLEYVPGNYADEAEIVELALIAAQFNGIYFTHMRNEGSGLLESIRESINIGKKANISVQINHLKATGQTQWGWSKKALTLIDSARQEGVDVSHDIYPYTAFSTISSILIPQWAMEGGQEGLRNRLADKTTSLRIKQEMAELFKRDAGGEDLTKIQFRDFKQNPTFSGKTLADYATHLGLPLTLETGIDLILDLELQGGFIGIFHAMSEDDIEHFLQHPTTMIDSDGDLLNFGEGHPHPRCYGAFPKVLGHFVRDQKVISLENAIHKMTYLPAEKIGLKDRGHIRKGAIADLVIFDFATINDNSTYTDPHHFPSGIKHVLINGEMVLEEEELTGQLPGKWMRREYK
ncbi:MAG: amidohydrolase family protein [Saprospiraceae bacterium]|nr:amidohydrolase family protein [Saprospiraceae bacterium]|tara:strand:+ start:10 stop:1605 length:1596 start_codon:yes stop_codon:yes gene_type:complete